MRMGSAGYLNSCSGLLINSLEEMSDPGLLRTLYCGERSRQTFTTLREVSTSVMLPFQ